MMNIDDYKQAIAWLRKNLAELERNPDDPSVQYAVLHTFEVTHNLSEAVLREAYVSLGVDEYAAYLSLRELIYRASEEGMVLSSSKAWLEHGLALERMREAFCLCAQESAVDAMQRLSQYADELELFARSVEGRLVSNG